MSDLSEMTRFERRLQRIDKALPEEDRRYLETWHTILRLGGIDGADSVLFDLEKKYDAAFDNPESGAGMGSLMTNNGRSLIKKAIEHATLADGRNFSSAEIETMVDVFDRCADKRQDTPRRGKGERTV